MVKPGGQAFSCSAKTSVLVTSGHVVSELLSSHCLCEHMEKYFPEKKN